MLPVLSGTLIASAQAVSSSGHCYHARVNTNGRDSTPSSCSETGVPSFTTYNHKQRSVLYPSLLANNLLPPGLEPKVINAQFPTFGRPIYGPWGVSESRGEKPHDGMRPPMDGMSHLGLLQSLHFGLPQFCFCLPTCCIGHLRHARG